MAGQHARDTSTGRAKRWLEFGFAAFTFPLVLLIYLVAAIWLLPYVLLSRPYRMHLKEARLKHWGDGWNTSPFSRQLASLEVTAFLTLPFKPIFAFMDWVEWHPAVRPLQSLKANESLKDERA